MVYIFIVCVLLFYIHVCICQQWRNKRYSIYDLYSFMSTWKYYAHSYGLSTYMLHGFSMDAASHYSDVIMSASRLFTEPFVQVEIRENIIMIWSPQYQWCDHEEYGLNEFLPNWKNSKQTNKNTTKHRPYARFWRCIRCTLHSSTSNLQFMFTFLQNVQTAGLVSIVTSSVTALARMRSVPRTMASVARAAEEDTFFQDVE